jgi:hypothetical protein
MKKVLLATLVAILFASCNNGKNVSIFEIGDSRDNVINTMANDFTIFGEHWTKDKIIDREHLDSRGTRKVITLYECVYKGQEYYKVRVYFSFGKVSRMEYIIEKDKMKNLHRRLKAKYGDSRRANLPSGLPGLPPSWEISTVYIGDIDGVVVTEDSQEVVRTHRDGTTSSEKVDVYELMVVSGEQYYELKSFL